MGELDETGLERVRFAVLKLSEGRPDWLAREIRGASLDWRDTLVAAGFGESVTAHHEWAQSYLAARE